MQSMDESGVPAKPGYWRSNLRLIGVLTAVWLLVGFVLPLWPPGAGSVGGAPIGLWIAAQGAPVAFVLLAWIYERCMDRLDNRHRSGTDE